jgi:hypothetical protein
VDKFRIVSMQAFPALQCEEFRQVARLPADGIRSDARGEVK